MYKEKERPETLLKLIQLNDYSLPSVIGLNFQRCLHCFRLYSQEIDKVHSLTLGKIIRLNTEFKSAPDNVFFSTDYCSGVDNFQCVPKTVDSTVTKASTGNGTRNALIAISVVMFVAIVIIGAVLAYLRFRSKPRKTKVISIQEAEKK